MSKFLSEIIARTATVMLTNGATQAQIEKVTTFLAKADKREIGQK